MLFKRVYDMNKSFNSGCFLKFIFVIFISLGCVGGDGFCSDPSSSSEDEDKPPAKRRRLSKSLPASNNFAQGHEVELERGKGSKKTGGGPGGFFWKIMYKEKSAGKVFINWIDIEPVGKHASIQIFLNKGSQGKHIGRIGYERACDLSEYGEVYAYMSKKNLASYKAAIAAGFKERKIAGISQRLMRWVRK